ncbi:hypothetical protein HDU99_006124 [Rhizoclosmatium hyalinum]|nr:hypothetical protein HDU99_006124 [Rhizoclosmatium hyalinum]
MLNPRKSIAISSDQPIAPASVVEAVVDEPIHDQQPPNQDFFSLPRQDIPLHELELTIDIMQARFLDFLNGEEGLTGDLFGGSLHKDNAFNLRTTWNRIHQYAKVIQSTPYDRLQIIQLARRSRVLVIGYRLLYEQPSMLTLLATATMERKLTASEARDTLKKEVEEYVEAISTNIFGWISPKFTSIRAMQEYFNAEEGGGMGIVMSSGRKHFKMLVHSIHALRLVGCTLPIEVVYLGKDDLTADMVKALQAIENVETKNLWEIFHIEEEVNGWAIKPFAILASSFRQTIFVDADALFFQDPETSIRQSTLFKQNGQLFFHDRTIEDKNAQWPVWYSLVNPEMTRYSKTLRFNNYYSYHEMESGVVVVDKSRTGPLLALLMTCQMNQAEESFEVYKHMHGDKETFWMAWDMTRVPYRFVPNYGGAVGYLNTTTGRVCGTALYHTDEYNRPFWWNGGIFQDKRALTEAGRKRFMSFDYVAVDKIGYDVLWEWDWENMHTPYCLGGKQKGDVTPLEQYEKDIGAQYIELYEEISEGGWKPFFNERYNTGFKKPASKKKKVEEMRGRGGEEGQAEADAMEQEEEGWESPKAVVQKKEEGKARGKVDD